MRRFLACAFLFFIAASSVLAAEDHQDAVREAFNLLLDKKYDKAREIVEPLSESGDADAQHLLGYIYENGFGVEADMARALDLYSRSALHGQTDSQFALGELAFTGNGVQQNYEYAAGWYKLAAARGHPAAKTRLGAMYAEGLGIKPDKEQAAQFFEQAADAGDPEAQYQMGSIYLVGDPRPQDYEKAGAYFEAAAGQGHAPSQFNLALMYDGGLLGAKSEKDMIYWMRAAAEGGMPNAMVAMGLLIHDGRIKSGLAADWFEKAAKAGDAQGQFLFAVALKEGDGRPQNLIEARQWVDRALSQKAKLPSALQASAEKLRRDLAR